MENLTCAKTKKILGLCTRTNLRESSARGDLQIRLTMGRALVLLACPAAPLGPWNNKYSFQVYVVQKVEDVILSSKV